MLVIGKELVGDLLAFVRMTKHRVLLGIRGAELALALHCHSSEIVSPKAVVSLLRYLLAAVRQYVPSSP
jgi:hypothetical protein